MKPDVRLASALPALVAALVWAFFGEVAGFVGAGLLVAAAAATALQHRTTALVLLALAATTTLGHVSTLLDWRAWAAAATLPVAVDAALRRPGRDSVAGWGSLVLSFAAMVATVGALAVFRPTRAAILAPDSVLPATLLLAAFGMLLAMQLVSMPKAST